MASTGEKIAAGALSGLGGGGILSGIGQALLGDVRKKKRHFGDTDDSDQPGSDDAANPARNMKRGGGKRPG
jgi:hypothetical protein